MTHPSGWTRLRAWAAFLLAVLGGCADPGGVFRPGESPPDPRALVVPSGYSQVSAGGFHTCALRDEGWTLCWGGTGPQVDGQNFAHQVSAGGWHSCYVTAAGDVVCHGDNTAGQSSVPPGLGPATQVSAGGYVTCALLADASVVCWGDAAAAAVPVGLDDVVAISAGEWHACALRADGSVVCWGSNQYGQTDVRPGLTGVVQVAAGLQHSCVLGDTGTVECWGDDTFGQASTPAGLGAVAQITAGFQHTCARLAGGNVVCWGDAFNGASVVPPGLNGVLQLSAGYLHTCALLSDTTLRCWGNNDYGQLAVPEIVVVPRATFAVTPTAVNAGSPFTLELLDAEVPGHPGVDGFTFAFDCGDGSGFTAFSPTPFQMCPTTVAEIRTVRGTVQDRDGQQASYNRLVTVVSAGDGFRFDGFHAPVVNAAINPVRGGQAVPLKFSLGGNRGIDIFAVGFPQVAELSCDLVSDTTGAAETVTAGTSSLSYNAVTDIYTYVWKTDQKWRGTCRRLSVMFRDGTVRTADFQFR